MDVNSAIALIGAVIYRPGWTIEAKDHTNRFEGSICVKITYPAQETGREMALQGYPENNRPYAEFPLVVRDLDQLGLYAELLDAILEIESHEAREYLRIHPTGWAPFHPHQIDGMMRWGKSRNHFARALRNDLQFGIS